MLMAKIAVLLVIVTEKQQSLRKGSSVPRHSFRHLICNNVTIFTPAKWVLIHPHFIDEKTEGLLTRLVNVFLNYWEVLTYPVISESLIFFSVSLKFLKGEKGLSGFLVG